VNKINSIYPHPTDAVVRYDKIEGMNERLSSIRHGNLKKPPIPRSELEELLANGPLRKINHILRKDEETKLHKSPQETKLAARYHNFTPLERDLRKKIQSKHGFPSEQRALDKATNNILMKLAKRSNIQSKTDYDRHEKKRAARRLRSKDSSPEATQLREEAKMPYHKAKRATISINPAEAQDENMRQRIMALRRILFINPKVETLKTAFMGNIVTKDGQVVKQLAHFITGASAKDMQVFFHGKTGHSLTNRDVHLLIYQGLREIPVARIKSKSGKVFLEITCSYPRWSAAHPGSLTNLDGSWTDGQINFYHRQKKLERKQVEQIFNRWLEFRGQY